MTKCTRNIRVLYEKKIIFHRRIIAELTIFIAESGYFALQNRPKNIAEFRGVCSLSIPSVYLALLPRPPQYIYIYIYININTIL